MKLRLVAVVLGVVGLLGVGAGPAGAIETPCVHPILYPHCG